jgi:hypothetical protein
MTIQIPDLDDDRILRRVQIDNQKIEPWRVTYTLVTWDTGRYARTGQCLIGYAMTRDGESEPLFVGEDCGVAPSHPIDSDDALRGLLGFLTLRPGDTDADYFAEYTDAQRAFAADDAESMSMYSYEPERGEEDSRPAFVDLDGRESD